MPSFSDSLLKYWHSLLASLSLPRMKLTAVTTRLFLRMILNVFLAVIFSQLSSVSVVKLALIMCEYSAAAKAVTSDMPPKTARLASATCEFNSGL